MHEELKKLVKFYDEMLRRELENATEKDYWVCSTTLTPLVKELGFEMVEDKCTKCGATVYRRPWKSKARIICEKCYYRQTMAVAE